MSDQAERVFKIQTNNANKGYVRADRQYGGLWLCVGDENSEQDVWLEPGEVKTLIAALTGEQRDAPLLPEL